MNRQPAEPLPPVTLVLGGARSGKSLYAERRIEPYGAGLYLATAEAGDAEMAERIRRHKERRGKHWITVEEPLDVLAVMAAHAEPGRPILVDCLSLWLSNLMHRRRDADAAVGELVAGLAGLAGPVVLVSNEVGLGIVPENDLARAYMDSAGRMNQSVAQAAERVVFMAAGLPMVLKAATDSAT